MGKKWPINVHLDYSQTITLCVPENCFVDELFRVLYNHHKAPKVCGYRLIHGGEQLDNTSGKRLSDYGIQPRSTLELWISLAGG